MFAYLIKTAGGAARLPDRPAALATDLETTICEQLGLKPGSLRD